MSTPQMMQILLGLYLASGLVISAYRNAVGKSGGHGLWVLLWAGWAWMWAAAHLPNAPLAAPLFAFAWLVVTLGLRRTGYAFRDSAWPQRMVWVLGPMHALGLAAAYIRDLRAGDDESDADASAFEQESAQEAFESVVELGETTLEEVMVPRSEIAYLEADDNVGEWIELLRRRGHRVVPVYGEDQDEVLGCVHLADLFGDRSPDVPIRDLVRDIRFVPEAMRCDDLLREMIAQEESLVIVVDEYGGTAGVVSDHDLFEILLGEINRQNPFAGRIVTVGEREHVADGHYRIDDLNEWAPSPLPEGDYETLGGLILDRLGKVPSAGEKLAIDGFELEVVQSSDRRILRVRLRFPVQAPAPPARDEG